MRNPLTIALLLFSGLVSDLAAQKATPIMARLQDVTRIQGADSHTIYGIGMVTGLKGTGDSAKAVRQMAVNFLQRLGHNRVIGDIATGGIAMVMVKAEIPAFAKSGQQLDATVSIMNDATSLKGGVLEITKLIGTSTHGEPLAGEATGRVFVGGDYAGTASVNVTRNHPTVGTAIRGCKLLSAPRSFNLSDAGHLELRFLRSSVSSVISAVDGINKLVKADGYQAEIVDQFMLRIRLPEDKQTEQNALLLMHRIQDLPIAMSTRAKVIIDEASGVILAGGRVQISPCAFAVADVHISIVSEDEISQPLPGINTQGTTERVNRTRVDVQTQATKPQAIKNGATVEELVKNLAALNLTPHQLIAVFQKLDVGGFLHAELLYR